jgi:hypothetical protein
MISAACSGYPGKGRVASSVGESEEERIWQILI